MYRVTVRHNYSDLHFAFADMEQASSFAFEVLEQVETENVKVELSIIDAEEETE